MQYFITFLEGIISFISPCMLPMLPIYISFFGGSAAKKHKAVLGALSFVLGFTVVFFMLGIFAGTIGALLNQYRKLLNIICGIIVILFGLSYLNVFSIPFLKGIKTNRNADNVVSAFLFGVIYSISLTPCVGAFLGSALMMASSGANTLKGGVLLLFYSIGLGIPFVISALLLEKLNTAFLFIKKNYKVINCICGIFLIIVGILMAFGLLDKMLALLA